MLNLSNAQVSEMINSDFSIDFGYSKEKLRLIGKNGKVPFGKDYFGRPRYVENSLDEKNLRDIAKTTDGKFYRASNNEALVNIFNEIDEFEKSEVKENRYKNTVDFYHYYLFWSIIFLIIFILLKSSFVNNILKD